MYEYKAKYIRNYDGDTITLVVDLGFKVQIKMNVRLADVNTPEIRTDNIKEKERAMKARDFVHDALTEAMDIRIKTKKSPGKYGRYIAEVFYDDKNLNEELLQEGLADPY